MIYLLIDNTCQALQKRSRDNLSVLESTQSEEGQVMNRRELCPFKSYKGGGGGFYTQK